MAIKKICAEKIDKDLIKLLKDNFRIQNGIQNLSDNYREEIEKMDSNISKYKEIRKKLSKSNFVNITEEEQETLEELSDKDKDDDWDTYGKEILIEDVEYEIKRLEESKVFFEHKVKFFLDDVQVSIHLVQENILEKWTNTLDCLELLEKSLRLLEEAEENPIKWSSLKELEEDIKQVFIEWTEKTYSPLQESFDFNRTFFFPRIGETHYQMEYDDYENLFYYRGGTFRISGSQTAYPEEHKKLLVLREVDKERKEFERLRSLYNSDASKEAGRKRKPIPQEVRIAVWRRDEGKCVECGSKESLEYDHIIPFSKGGSDSVRNIQLLCENCNREKSNKI
jgi:hypothetical protein